MYLFDWTKTVAALRQLVQGAVATEQRAGSWVANLVVEEELALQALEFLVSHLIQHEQFTGAAHLLAHASPVTLRCHPRFLALVERALVAAGPLETAEKEALKYTGGLHQLEDTMLRHSPQQLLPQRAWFWLYCVRLRGCKQVLEYGTGCGLNIFALAQLEPEVEWYGTDISREQVTTNEAQARRLGLKNAHFLQLESAQGFNFDSVALLDTLEHTAFPLELLGKAEACVKRPGGMVTVVVPYGPWSLGTNNDHGEKMVSNHVNVSSTADLCGLAKQRGRALAADTIEGGPTEGNASACVSYEPRSTP